MKTFSHIFTVWAVIFLAMFVFIGAGWGWSALLCFAGVVGIPIADLLLTSRRSA